MPLLISIDSAPGAHSISPAKKRNVSASKAPSSTAAAPESSPANPCAVLQLPYDVAQGLAECMLHDNAEV